jgi:hypothetical protein
MYDIAPKAAGTKASLVMLLAIIGAPLGDFWPIDGEGGS